MEEARRVGTTAKVGTISGGWEEVPRRREECELGLESGKHGR